MQSKEKIQKHYPTVPVLLYNIIFILVQLQFIIAFCIFILKIHLKKVMGGNIPGEFQCRAFGTKLL